MKLRVAVGVAALGIFLGGMATSLNAAPVPVDAAAAKKKVALAPEGLEFGLTLEGLSVMYSNYFESIYQESYAQAEPGPALEALEAEVGDKKALIKRNHIQFGNTPTGIDQSALKGEYTYGNGESLSRLRLNDRFTRNFFFFGNKLWKIYDEYDLTGGGNLGSNFEEAVAKLTQIFGAAPKRVTEDFAHGRMFQEARWKTETMLIRAVGRDPILGVVYSDLTVEENLENKRGNRAADPNALDRDVRSVTKGR